MERHVYRYQFEQAASMAGIEALLELALLGAQALNGESRMTLDARYLSDAEQGVLVIDAGTPLGQSLNQLFVGYVREQYGDRCFRVDRIERMPVAAGGHS